MKIVHCFFTLEMGGAQVLAVDLLNKMCSQHDMALIVVNNIHSQALLDKLDKRVAVYKINRKEGSRNPWPLLKFNLLLRRLNPDIIHCHEPDIGKIIKAGVGKLLYTIHDVAIPTTYYHYYSTLVAISDAVQQELAQRFDRPIKKVYNAIDVSAFKKRTDYSGAGKKIKLVQISRLMHEKKGHDVLLHALSQLKKDSVSSNFSLDIVGSGDSLSFLQNLVSTLNLTSEVSFLGERNRDWLYQNLAQYHLLVQPSRYEGFGLTILEGFAAGLPVLASDIEGPAEIISRTPRGYLFKKGDSQDCAHVLQSILDDYESGRIALLMQNSKPVTEQEYSISACVGGYLQEYQALLT
ncbi:glycosyltransferase family 4 protein [Hymenobacter sp. HDW8]|uniref:glycosyltransferase family 4 protein n=1 Tax=Hymenobacter sp. HDW8 TaxID=2714932 RepID=UPI00140D6238|nr:glycosyltransferase family 4 protein [Hymenobacter sp. HDW8]QIL77330.1 glycosyltransferase family 4 protein [Hymenobacter sp. HDW8]